MLEKKTTLTILVICYNKKEYGEYNKRITTHMDEQFQLKAINGTSINDKETLSPQGRLQLIPRQHYAQVLMRF